MTDPFVLPREDGARLLKLAALQLREKDYASAEAAALLVTAADPTSADAWLIVGVARAKRDEHARALPAYLRALELRPSDISAWTDLGEVYLTLLRNEEAAAAFRQAIRLDPEALHPAGRRARAVVGRTLSELKRAAKST
jgi:cytochrome c-type biogenesis protein CcmH/NrfG